MGDTDYVMNTRYRAQLKKKEKEAIANGETTEFEVLEWYNKKARASEIFMKYKTSTQRYHCCLKIHLK